MNWLCTTIHLGAHCMVASNARWWPWFAAEWNTEWSTPSGRHPQGAWVLKCMHISFLQQVCDMHSQVSSPESLNKFNRVTDMSMFDCILLVGEQLQNLSLMQYLGSQLLIMKWWNILWFNFIRCFHINYRILDESVCSLKVSLNPQSCLVSALPQCLVHTSLITCGR